MRARVDKDLSQSELGKLVGIRQTDISKIERQGWVPPAELRAKLADALGVTEAELFSEAL